MDKYDKEFAPACDRNSQVILDVLREILGSARSVLEIGSGTGQHAAFFARALPHLILTPSDRPGHLDSIHAWRHEAQLDNLQAPLVIDLLDEQCRLPVVDAILCINTIHIMAWEGTQRLLRMAGQYLRPGGILYVYGPYRYADRPLEPSNESFDQWLKDRDPASGIRDFEAVDSLACLAGLDLQGDIAMPANNRSIWWRKPIQDSSG